MKHFSWLSFRLYWKFGILGLLRNPTKQSQWERFAQFTIDMVFHGFTSADTWSVDCSIVEFALPRIRMFRNYMPCGRPADLTDEEWINIVDKIIKGLDFYKRGRCDGNTIGKKKEKKMEEGMKLFHEYFGHLWN